MAKRRPVSETDAKLFRQAVGPVKPVRDDRVHPEPRRPSPRPAQRDPGDGPDPTPAGGVRSTEPGGDEALFYRPGLRPRTVRQLRRGQVRVDAHIDLHGMTVAEAGAALTRFLGEARARGLRCVRVVHGKGLRSPEGRGTLKGEVDGWLRRQPGVVAFASARPADGGTGAVYVLLRAGGGAETSG